jgi:hypothetical protein
VVGQVEPRLGETITRAHVWLVQAPGHTEQCVWDVIVLAAIAAMETGRRYMAASRRRGGDQGEPRLEAGVELAERRNRGLDGLLGSFGRLRPTRGAEARMGLDGSLPPFSQGNGNGSEMRRAVI